jgi:pimeloyl-ACP methyl ester carboxylesterase
MTMQFEFHTIGDHELRLARVHRGDRPTVLMTNAFPQSIRCWESLWERLTEHFDLVAVDLPGFGLSRGGAGAMRPSAQAEVLLAVMDHLAIDRAIIVGPDVGVPIALWLASEHPERIDGVNVYDGPGTWPTDFDPALGSAVRSALVRWLGVRPPMRAYLMRQNFSAATSAGYHQFTPSKAAVEEYRAVCFDPERHRRAFDYLGSYADELPQLEARLSSVEVPVLITWGAHDGFVRPTNAERLHALLPDSELTVFQNAGHFSHEDADDAWLERFVTFVDSRVAPWHQPRTQPRRAVGG